MESLETLNNFTNKYPQKSGNFLNYSFLGGTAVRLVQEDLNNFEKREISDFDIIRFDNEKYPVHNLNPEIVFGIVDLDRKDLFNFVSSTKIKNKNYYFMDPTFLSFTKSCAIDNPREKDFNDINYLVSTGKINYDKLSFLFDKTGHLNNSKKIALENFNWFFADSPKNLRLKSRLFQSFPRFINIISEFGNYEDARDILLNYTKKDSAKNGYALSSVIYNSHSAIRELNGFADEIKMNFLENLLDSARKNDYIDFDRKINREVIPKLRYSKNKEKVLSDFKVPNFK